MIRPAGDADIARVLRVWQSVSRDLGRPYPQFLRLQAARGQLLVDDESWGFVSWYRRRDGVATVYDIAVPIKSRGRGIAKALLDAIPGPIVLKCPVDLESNGFYRHIGFKLCGIEAAKRPLNLWRRE